MTTQFTSPVMRLVQGSLFEAQTTDQQGKPRVVQSGPRAGQPSPQWFVAGAIRKDDPAWPAFKALIDAECAADWPQLFPQGPHGPCVLPTFSNKIIDGDGFDTTGKHNATKEGFAGHWVVRFASGFAPKVFSPGHYAPHEQILDPNMARRGWFYRFVGSLETNNNPQKPGIYVNLAGAEIVAYGEEIVGGPDFATAFGATPVTNLPPGASAAPLTTPPAAAFAPAPVQAPPAAYAPAPVQAPPYTAPMMAPPPAPAAPAPPPAPLQRRMTAKANGAPYESFIQQGWTDTLLIQNGYMEDVIPV